MSHPAGNLSSGIRRYGSADVIRVKFVKSAQRLGFSLDEIAQWLRWEMTPSAPKQRNWLRFVWPMSVAGLRTCCAWNAPASRAAQPTAAYLAR